MRPNVPFRTAIGEVLDNSEKTSFVIFAIFIILNHKTKIKHFCYDKLQQKSISHFR